VGLKSLDHVTIRTSDLGRLEAFYCDCLGLKPGARPPFSFNGAWLYCDGRAALHLAEVPQQPEPGAPRIEHFAFQAEGLADFLAHLRARSVPYRITIVPGIGLRQVNVNDPDGNHVEIAFAADEEADLSDFTG
jgi:catechol 2,3-dioxygenase-like lactoylglutathione lyase family enzyme